MKKLLALLLAVACLLGLTACGAKLEEPPEPSVVSPDKTISASGEILETPPELRIAAGDGTVTSSKGTYSWSYFNGYVWPTIESDSIHPLEYKDHVETLTTADNTVTLEFDVPPDSISAEECWSDENWGNTDAESEWFELNGSEITLKPGGWIYTIRAKWDAEGYNGSCRYVFHAVCPE